MAEWTEDRVERAKKMWTEGLSASQIAGRLGDVSRNAVIGKLHRLGLTAKIAERPTHARTKADYRKSRNERLRAERASKPKFGPSVTGDLNSLRKALENMDAEPDDSGTKRLVINHDDPSRELKHTSCRWPLGDPGHEDFHFCGRDKLDGLPYCTHHARIAFVPQVRKTNTGFADLQRKQRERKLA